MSAAKQVVKVDFYSCCNLTGLLSTDLSRLWKLMLTGTAFKNGTLLRILNSCKDELIELNLTSTCISLCKCLPKIVELKKLKYFAAPPNGDISASETIRAVVKLVERC